MDTGIDVRSGETEAQHQLIVLSQFTLGVRYFFRGMVLLRTEGIRALAFLPLLLSGLVCAGLLTWANQVLVGVVNDAVAWLPAWLSFVGIVARVVFWTGAILVLLFGFVALSSLVSCPFNGPLAEAVERRIAAESAPRSPVMRTLLRLPLVFLQEAKKLLYFAIWAVPFLALFLTPAAPLAPFAWFAFSAWMIALEFVDYPMDNHELSFREMRRRLRSRKMLAFGFGSAVLTMAGIPIVNLLVVPSAVAGATLLWIDVYSKPSGRHLGGASPGA